ncbi:unnamed protein product [Camellia sinensis]
MRPILRPISPISVCADEARAAADEARAGSVCAGASAAAVCARRVAIAAVRGDAAAVRPKGATLLLCERCGCSYRHWRANSVQVSPNQPYYCPSMDAIEDSMCRKIDLTICLVWMPHKTVFMYRYAPVSTIGDDIGSTSHTQAGMVNNISSQSSIVPSNFVDLNIDRDPNVPFFF